MTPSPRLHRPDRPSVYGHRGASAALPENTIEAFRAARQQGADGVELDVRRTSDGHTAVHHDAHLPDGRVICELARRDLPSAIPGLAPALDACRPLLVNIEIKNSPADPDFDATDGVARQVVKLLDRRAADGPADDVLISSFNPMTVAVVRQLAPHLPTALLTLDDPVAWVPVAMAAGHEAIHPWDPTVDASLVDAAHAGGLAVNVWTVDDPARIVELAALGVDGIVTNAPDVALRALAGLASGGGGHHE